jgi:predicted phosphodiesterase
VRRLALFSDIHGNLPALDAALEDIAAAGIAAEERLCLGDLVGYGPYPAGVIARIRDEGIAAIRGNYDDGVGNSRGHCGCHYATAEAKADGEASYAFTDAALGESDHAWLAALPDGLRFDHRGSRVVLAHGSPRKINEYLLPDRTDAFLAKLADAAQADVVCVGHTHGAYHRALVGGDGRTVHYVNSGSVGKPKDRDARAGWVELRLPDEGRCIETEVHRVAYDVEAVVAEMERAGLPKRLGAALRTG